MRAVPSLPVRIAFVLAVAAFTGCQNRTPGASPPFNVLVISYDTLRADHLGLYGNHRDTSPNLDRLADQAVVFEKAIAQSSSTFPSHMSLFQSRYASRISSDAPMLAEILNDLGYATAAFTGGGNVAGELGFDKGFDIYEESRHTEGLADSIPPFLFWLQEVQAKPFFSFLHTYDIHHPYDPPPPYDSLFYSDYSGPISGKYTGPLLNELAGIHDYPRIDGDISLSVEDRRKIEALYDGGVRYADSYLTEIERLLTELDLWDSTIIVVLSDHGEEFWDHNGVLHSFTVFQEMIHVPLVIKMPNREPGGIRIGQQVRLMDVAPTLLDLLDLPIPETMLGQSLLPMIEGAEETLTAVSEMGDYKALIDYPHKLIVNATESQGSLFNLASDPGELHDLFEQKPEQAKRLHQHLAQELGSSLDRWVDGIPKDLPQDEELIEQLRALGYLE